MFYYIKCAADGTPLTYITRSSPLEGFETEESSGGKTPYYVGPCTLTKPIPTATQVLTGPVYDTVAKTITYSVENTTLADLKIAKLAELKVLFDGKYAEGRKYTDTHVYKLDSDHLLTLQAIRVALLAGETNPHNGYWPDEDGTARTFDDAGITALILNIFNYTMALNRKYRDHKIAINDETDFETLATYDVDSGWPANN